MLQKILARTSWVLGLQWTIWIHLLPASMTLWHSEFKRKRRTLSLWQLCFCCFYCSGWQHARIFQKTSARWHSLYKTICTFSFQPPLKRSWEVSNVFFLNFQKKSNKKNDIFLKKNLKITTKNAKLEFFWIRFDPQRTGPSAGWSFCMRLGGSKRCRTRCLSTCPARKIPPPSIGWGKKKQWTTEVFGCFFWGNQRGINGKNECFVYEMFCGV